MMVCIRKILDTICSTLYKYYMIKSMTAFARGGFQSHGQRYIIEIQSVNRKTLEMHFHMPREFLFAELHLKKVIARKVHRGQLTVRISRELTTGQHLPNLPSNDQLKHIVEYVSDVKASLNITEDMTLPLLFDLAARIGQSEVIEDEKRFLEEISEGCAACVDTLFEMKCREGEELKKDFLFHIQKLQAIVEEIAAEGGSAKDRFEKRLSERMKDFAPIENVEDDRLIREIAILGEKIDIAEEITRLRSHCGQFLELLEKDEERLGRTFEFLLQEMNREANTIASKSQELSISQKVVTIKSELDKLREQIQNVE